MTEYYTRAFDSFFKTDVLKPGVFKVYERAGLRWDWRGTFTADRLIDAIVAAHYIDRSPDEWPLPKGAVTVVERP